MEANEIQSRTKLRDVIKYPANLVEFLFSIVWWIIELPVIRCVTGPIRTGLFRLLFFFAPYWPTAGSTSTLGFTKLWRSWRWFFLIGFLVGLFLALGGSVLFSHLDGRLLAAEPRYDGIGLNTYNFMDDWANIILYALVVPFYVACGTVIIGLCWGFQNQTVPTTDPPMDGAFLLEDTRPNFGGNRVHLVLLSMAVIAFVSWFSKDYQNNVFQLLTETFTTHLFKNGMVQNQALPFLEYVIKPIEELNEGLKPAPILYWFLERTNGEIRYNASGYFYIALNTALLLFTVISVLMFLSAGFSVANLRDRIERGEFKTFGDLEDQLGRYVLAFVLAKWIFVAYVINTYIWRGSMLGSVGPVDTAIIAYTIIGSFLLPIPNRILEIFWYSKKRREYIISPKSERPSFQSLTPSGWPMVLKNTANVLLSLIFVDTIFNLKARIVDVIEFVTN